MKHLKLGFPMLIAFLIIIALFLLTQQPAMAEDCESSHTMTFEPGTVIYTFDLQYEVFDWWYWNLVFEKDISEGSVYDLSTTVYINIMKHMYSTAGIRLSHQDDPDRKWTPYLSVTYRF